MQDKYIITEAETEDAIGIRNVQKEAWLNTYPNSEHRISVKDIRKRFNLSEEEEIRKIEERKKEIREDKFSHTFVAKDQEKIIGFCVVRKLTDHNRIGALYILPKYQGLGIGTKLLEKGLEWLGEGKEIRLGVASYNLKTIRFYQKFGFVKSDKPLDLVSHRFSSGAIIPELEMVKK